MRILLRCIVSRFNAIAPTCMGHRWPTLPAQGGFDSDLPTLLVQTIKAQLNVLSLVNQVARTCSTAAYTLDRSRTPALARPDSRVCDVANMVTSGPIPAAGASWSALGCRAARATAIRTGLGLRPLCALACGGQRGGRRGIAGWWRTCDIWAPQSVTHAQAVQNRRKEPDVTQGKRMPS
jgi:hypothetical protein